MMKRIKGFTLVELLAVIVILAIVLIIAVPGVLSIINKTKEKAYQSQLSLIKDTARTYVTTTSPVWTDDTVVVSLSDLQDLGMLDKKLIDPRDKSEMKGISVLVTKVNSRMKYELVYSDSSNANYPVLSAGMIPIRYDGTNWVKADYTNEKQSWFDYSKQNWANIATVTSDVRDSLTKANIGTVVPMDKINTMFVWIPRFNYKLFNVDGTVSPVGNPNMVGDYTIDIGFENKDTKKSNGTKNGEYLTHPAFTFGEEELSGMWVGKFETGYRDATTGKEAEQNIIDSSKIVIKPNSYAWRKLNVSNMYKNAKGFNSQNYIYGMTSSSDSHMMKNSEWGMLTYLTHSNYGKMGNSDYSLEARFVSINNNQSLITGCGTAADKTQTTICKSYETNEGKGATTTGNITGIYDTNGGATEYVMGVMKSNNGTDLLVSRSNFNQDELNQLGKDKKYVDVYEYGTDWYEYTRAHLGDATIEIGPHDQMNQSLKVNVWDGISRFLYNKDDLSWFPRDITGFISVTYEPNLYGNMSFDCGNGETYESASFRIVLA